MAKNTNPELKNQMIYSVYIRNHTKEGTFAAFAKDLDRIKALGTDIIWLMPIHPIGIENKKGALGCPYSIKDFRKINTEYGTMQDFINLVEQIHKKEMKIIIDVVYGHTSHDSRLFTTHKDFYYKRQDGTYGCKIGDWSDIIDLDYSNRMLWDYQLETLKMWAEYVDGFRCDVASSIPVDFWEIARLEINGKNPDFFWLAESVDGNFIKSMRDNGYNIHSDGELYEAFDCLYDYDVKEFYEGYLNGTVSLERYIEELNRQEVIFPKNYIKLRFLENHDMPRIAKRVKSRQQLINLTAFMFFEKGMPLIYAGQEMCDSNCPSLFDKDIVDWDSKKDISTLISKLAKIKKLSVMVNGAYSLRVQDGVVIGSLKEDYTLTGVFDFENTNETVKTNITDGTYTNLITNTSFTVENGRISTSELPVIFML